MEFIKIRISLLWIIIILLGAQSCSNPADTVSTQTNEYLDSLLIDAVNSTNVSDFEVALNKLERVVKESKAANEKKHEIQGYLNIGLLYYNYSAEEEALNYFFQSLDYAKKYHIEELLNSIYNNIGIVYSTNNQLKQAEEYFRQALELSIERKEKKKQAINLVNLGSVTNAQEKNEEAFQYFDQAYQLFLEQNDSNSLSAVLNNIGNIYYDERKYSEARKNYIEAINLSENQNDKLFLSFYKLNLGKTQLQFNEYDSALVNLNTSLQMLLSIKNTGQIVENYHWLGKTYNQMGDPEKAIENLNKSLSWKDTLLNEKTQKWISEMQMKYEFGKKEKEIEFLHQKSKQQKMIWGGIIAAFFIFSLLLFYSLRVKNTNLKQHNIILTQEQEVAALRIAKNEADNKLLKEEIQHKNRELSSKALHLINKNEILSSIAQLLDEVDVQQHPKNAGLIREAKRSIRRNIDFDEEWKAFKIHFEQVYQGFFSRLVKNYPSLSQADLRLSAYLLIDLNAKEIAQICNISPDSVRKRKERLKKKLQLSTDEDIRNFLNRYGNG